MWTREAGWCCPTRAQLSVLLGTALLLSAASASLAAPPRPELKTWTTRYKGRAFHVVQLPRSDQLEAVISYEPAGETRARAMQRLGGIATLTGSFHHPRTLALADFLQKNGTIVSGATTGRSFLSINQQGAVDISRDYNTLKGRAGVSAMALGQRLIPFHQDGFSKAFMNAQTARMAIGLSRDSIYLVEARTDIWRLAAFMKNKLPCTTAINSDGGHVVQGRAPVHLVFRWRHATSPTTQQAALAKPRPRRIAAKG